MKIVGILIAAGIALAACSTGEVTDTVSEPAPTVTKTVPAPAPAAPEKSVEEKAYDLLVDDYGFAGVPKSAIDSAARAICNGFDDGLSFESVALIAYNNDFTAQQAGGLIAYSIFTQCPEYDYLIE